MAISRNTGADLRDVDDKLRGILAEHGKVEANRIADDGDLFAAGLTSFTAVQVMFAIEAGFGIEFPDEMLKRETFASIGMLRGSVESLLQLQEAG